MSIEVIDQGSLSVGKTFDEFAEICTLYGAKAAGLLMLPIAWVPPFVAISTSINRSWKTSKSIDHTTLHEIYNWARTRQITSIIIRSSSKNESINDRGKYKSIADVNIEIPAIATAVEEIYYHADNIDPLDEMGLIIQEYKPGKIQGHLSNEVRLSPTRNQWTYETENPWSPSKGVNSKFAPLPDHTRAIAIVGTPHHVLRSIGKWCCDEIIPRAHIEWLISGRELYLVQIDLEWRELDDGVDPSKQNALHGPLPSQSEGHLLTRYAIGSDTRWNKLKNLSEFDFDSRHAGPIIYQLPARVVERGRSDRVFLEDLINEISVLTANRAVVRTDVDQRNFRQFNLPRTDTVPPREALSWCLEQILALKNDGADIENIIFLVHAFIPARAAAWAYAEPDQQEVIIDALWGLPDGLQVLPVDSYEANPERGISVPLKSTYKPMYLCEDPTGKWTYVRVRRTKGRSKVLAKRDVLEIARRTKLISQRLGAPAQIMWFSSIPEEFGIGRNIPWFRSREKADPAPRIDDKYRDFLIRTESDLERLPAHRAAIKLAPEAHLIRDDTFFEKLIAKAKESGFPVKLEGSVLGHIYYRLCEEKIGVILPNAPKYHRKRERRLFGKIVRDKIPARIESGGERVQEAVLRFEDMIHGLTAKVIEEFEELIGAGSRTDQLAEMADVFEVVRGASSSLGIPFDEVISKANEKRDRLGGFSDRRLLIETSSMKGGAIAKSEYLRDIELHELSNPVISGPDASVPISSIVNTINRIPLVVIFRDLNICMRLQIKSGRLMLSLDDSGDVDSSDGAQGDLFAASQVRN